MHPNSDSELAWIRAHMPRLRRALDDLPDLAGVRLACSVHLEIKMVPLFEGLLARGAKLFLTTCNPTTVRDEIVALLRERGAEVEASCGMPPAEYAQAVRHALDWRPTHLVEMGADLTTALHERGDVASVRAGLEGTGSGVSRLAGLKLRYPVFNYDDLPIKEGLHNRFMVGLTTWQAFFDRTRLTLHGRQVLVIGYGSVGRGVADAARAFGGTVLIAERDPARALEASYAGWRVLPLEAALAEADVIVTATGAGQIIHAGHLPLLRDGAFLLNVGHRADEFDVDALRAHPCEELLPFIEAIRIGDRTVYLFAGASMANLTAGKGDSLNSFDLTVALLAAGTGHLVRDGERQVPGLHLLPRPVWQPYLETPCYESKTR
jgi:adenosylhomocysteinase